MLSKFYINLARSTARRAFMEAQFAKLGWDVERIEAVDGSQLKEGDHPPLTDWAKNKLGMTKGEIGCFMSHQDAWRRIANGPAPFGLVMEDDILISEAVLPLLANLDWIPADCECLKLDVGGIPAFQARPVPISVRGFSLTRPATHLYSTAAYIISKSSALHLCDRTKTIGGLVDAVMFRKDHAAASRLSFCQLYPAIAVQQSYTRNGSFLPKDAELSVIGKRTTIPKAGQETNKEMIMAFLRGRQTVVMRRLRAIYYLIRYRATLKRVPFIDYLK